MTKINQELVSAYLDGELTAEEQGRVEQALAADADLRRLHDDLRALRQNLQAMPPQKLDLNFSSRVLRAIEQAKDNAHQPHHEEPEVVVAVHHGSQTTVSPAQHEPMSLRVMIWSVAALAAAIVLVLMMPDQTARIATNIVVPTDEKPVEQPDESPQKDRVTDLNMRTNRRELSKNEVGERKEVRVEAAKSVEQAGKDADRAEEETKAKSFTDNDDSRDAAGAKKETPEKETHEKQQSVREELDRADVTQSGGGAGRAGTFGNTGRNADAVSPKPAAMAEARGVQRQLKEMDDEAGELLVVRLQVSRETVAKRGIDKILAQQQIELQSTTAPPSIAKSGSARDQAKLDHQDGERSRGAARNAASDDFHEVHQQIDQLAKASPAADVIYVEASREQVEAAMAALQEETGEAVKFAEIEKGQAGLGSTDKALRRNAYAADSLQEPLAKKEADTRGKPTAAAVPADSNGDTAAKEGESLARTRGAFAHRIAPASAAAQAPGASSAGGAAPPPPAPAAVQDAATADRKADEAAGETVEGAAKPRAAERFLKRANTPQDRVRVIFVIEAKPEE